MKRVLLYLGICVLILISCEKEDDINNLSNKVEFSDFSVSEISFKTAQISSKIPETYGLNIIQHGHCWSENQNPTIADAKTMLGTLESNVFTSEINNLEHNTNYYVKVYVEFQDVIYYSDSIFTFKTNEILAPSVTTVEIKRVTVNNAEIKSIINNNNGGEIISQGICWNTSGFPTINDNITIDELSDTTYSSFMTNLVVGTTYYIRAYAINEIGIEYGGEIELNYNWGVIQVQDYDGNWYNTVKIGDQIWLKENLRTTHYPDGTPINNGAGVNVASESTPEYYFVYDDNEENADIYGRLYTWYTSTKACPDGWHMATKNDWDNLLDYVDNAGKLKSTGTIEDGTGLWKSPNTGATDEYGFSLVPTGWLNSFFPDYIEIGISVSYNFYDDGEYCYAFGYNSSDYVGVVSGNGYPDKDGYPVRCIKDE